MALTHDELLTKVDSVFYEDEGGTQLDLAGFNNQYRAIRAVVELHKPKEEDGKLWCEHEVCYNHIEFLERDDCDCSYPCATIQAIEKELSNGN